LKCCRCTSFVLKNPHSPILRYYFILYCGLLELKADF
jgi:hypothetical protein